MSALALTQLRFRFSAYPGTYKETSNRKISWTCFWWLARLPKAFTDCNHSRSGASVLSGVDPVTAEFAVTAVPENDQRMPGGANAGHIGAWLDNVVTMMKRRPGMITATEAAQLTGLARRTIYALAEQGRIPHYRIGSALRFDPVELAEWLERQKAA